MRKKLRIAFNYNHNHYIDIDEDVYEMLSQKNYWYKISPNDVVVINEKRKKIPIWKLARRQFNKAFTIKYKDGDKFNIKRDNLLLVFKD